MVTIKGIVVPVLGTVSGIVVGAIADKELGKQDLGVAFSTARYTLAIHDLILIIVGFVLVMFGGRIHRFVKYFGLGFLAYNLGEEIYELATGATSF